jgi:Rrf2 family protein
MRMSQGVEWAVHACAVLAPLPPGRGLSLAALAEFHGVPQAYMAKQMQLLSKAGIVRTSRGKTGGYALARPATDVTLLDITRALSGTEPLLRNSPEGPLCGAARGLSPPMPDRRRLCRRRSGLAQAAAGS